MTDYRQAIPRGRVEPFVERYWFLSGEDEPGGGAPRPIFPDGAMEMVLHLGDPFEELREGADPALQPLSMVVGQMEAPVRVRPTGRADVVGVRLSPTGARALLRVPAAELRGRLVELSDLVPAAARTLRERLGDETSTDRRAALLDALLPALLVDPRPAPRSISFAAARLFQDGGRTSVDALARESGVGARQLERLFHEWVGLPPKSLGRILRFQTVLGAMTEGDGPSPAWAEVALACGYFDQAHLTRDFREFTGEPPARALSALDRFTESFVRGPAWRSDFSKTAGGPGSRLVLEGEL